MRQNPSSVDDEREISRRIPYIKLWVAQFHALMFKNFSLIRHSIVLSLSLVTIPALVTLLFNFDNATPSDFLFNFGPFSRESYGNTPLTCNGISECTFVLFSPSLDSNIENIMRNFASRLDLDVNNEKHIKGFQNFNQLGSYIQENPGKFATAISFDYVNGSEIAGLLNTNLLLSEIGYTIFQNQSLPLSNVKTTKITIDASILDIINGSITRVSSLNVHSKEFKWAPQIQIEAMPEYYAVAQSMYSKNSCIGHGVFSCFFGVPILGITMMIFAVSFLFAVASEKSNGIVGFLKVMGLMDSVYWFTWLLTLGFCGFIFSMLMAGLGKVSGAAIFVNSDFLALALVFFSVVIVLGASALAFSSLFSKPKWVRAVVFLQILFCIAFSFIFGSSMPESPNQMTNLAVIISAPSMSVILKMLTFLIPWFHFARLYVSLLNGTGLKQNEIGGKVTQSYFTLKSYTTRPKHLTLAGLASCSEFPSCCDVYDICFEIPSGLESLFILLAISLIFLFLAWYFGQVFAPDEGAVQKPLFLFSKSYWGFKSNASKLLDDLDTVSVKQKESADEKSLILHKISKVYKEVAALKELSIKIKYSKITALLGPNGAGKSTALKILSGQTNASYGQVFLFGEDIEENTAFLRENVGVCPQENILWDRMSAIEHVWFYGRLKGMSSRGLTAIARSTLTQFMLDDSIHKLSSQMSGGMKRRLMICNSLITNPKLLVMDEITAGLDPLTKHRVWEKIKSLRNDRIILLTTHNMEEADFLGDEIVILYGGRIRAFGNSLFLKNRFGAGYQVKVVTSSSFTTVVVDNVRKLLPAATIVSQEAGAITISLPRRALASFPKFFHWLESQRIPGSNAENSEEDLALKGWSFSNSTLEEVFLRLCSDEKSVNKGISEAGPQLCALCNERYSESVTVYTKQGIAVIAENLLCHRCATGEEQETLFGDLDKVTKEMEDEKNGESNLSNTKKIRSSIPEYNHEKVHPSFNRVPFMTLTYRQIRGVILKNLSLSLVQKWSIIVRLFILIILSLLNIPFSLSGLGGGGILCAQGYKSISGSCTIGVTYDNNEHLTFQRSDGVQKWLMQYPYYSSDPKVWQVMYSDSSLSGSTDFSELYNVFGQEIYYAQSLQSIFVKFGGGTNAPATDVDSFIEERESQLLNFLTVKTSFIGENNCSSSWIPAERVVSMNSTDSLFDILTPIVVEINEMNFASRSFDFTFHHVGASTMENFTRFNYLNVWRDSFISGTGERDICQQIYWMDLDVDELLLEISHLFTYLIARKSNPDARISAAIVKLPILEYPSVVASVSSTSKVVASVLCVFLTTFFFNDHVNRQVYEKSDDLFFLIKVSGMHPWIYWLANYVHDFFFNIVVSLIYFICRYVTNYPVHQGASKGFLVLCLFLGAHTMACFVAFFTIFFKRSFPARMLAFLLIFALAGLSPAFISNSFPSWLEKLLTFIPPIAFSRSIGLTFSFAPYSFDHTLTLLSMAFISPLFLLVGVLRVDSGARFYLFRKLCSRSKRERSASVTNSFISVVEDNVDVKVPIELRTLPYSNAPIKIDHLSKKYKGASKWSLKDLTVNVDYGECFGLLGPNGAGKSTALNILCGYLWPSNGTVKILEHDLLSEAQEISGMMGVCPQFDKSWDDLTVRQHFLFFARIKGIDPSLERGLAQKTAEMVSLDGDVMHQKASTLSGGNRRRISIAISLIGDPTIWLIDEPTSSLSPEIRRMIWEVIDNQKKAGRAIILTTHSMDEADALCSRIGIMVRGSMKTCGTPTFLKEKYGEGYYFTLTFDQKITKSLIDESLALVRKNFCSSAVYLENIESEKFATFLFPKGSTSTTDVLRVFEIMEGKQGEFKKVHHIAEWGISQATLEDIFIKTVETENQS